MYRVILGVYRFFQSGFSKFRTKIVSASFRRNAILGESFTCSHIAKCVNLTSDKSNIVIGSNCEINGTILAEGIGKVSIGQYTTIRFRSIVHAINRIEIGNYVIISNNVTIMDNNNHPVSPQARIEMSKSGFYSDLWSCKHSSNAPIIIEDNVWIGEKATILKGVRIGKGSIVALGAIVTKDVPPYSIAAGNPARVVKQIE